MKLTIAMLVLLAASPAVAQTQARMNADSDRQWKAADAEMTVIWQRVNAYMKRLDQMNTTRGGGFGYAAGALASQRAWLAFRDAQCVIEGGEFAGGSMQAMTMAQCKARLTRERTAQLRGLLWNR